MPKLKFSFNIDSPDHNDFMGKCKAAGMDAVRMHVPVNISLSEINVINDKLDELDMKAAICPKYEIKNTGEDQCLLDLANTETVLSNYKRISQNFSTERSLGVSLPIGMQLAIKSRYFSRFGMHRSQAISMLNNISLSIKESGHDVIMPVIIDDILPVNLWNNVSCDVYDIEMMLSRNSADNCRSESLVKSGKRLWFGKAGTIGGYKMPSSMVKTLKNMKSYAEKSNIEYVFLWSEKEAEEYHWSKDGVMLVDVMHQTFYNLNK